MDLPIAHLEYCTAPAEALFIYEACGASNLENWISSDLRQLGISSRPFVLISRERSVPAAGGTDFSWRFLWLTGTTRVIFCAPLVKHACAHLAQDTHFNLAPIASVAPDQTKHAWDGYKFLALTGCARTTGFVSTLTSLL